MIVENYQINEASLLYIKLDADDLAQLKEFIDAHISEGYNYTGVTVEILGEKKTFSLQEFCKKLGMTVLTEL